MRTDPKPVHTAFDLYREGPIISTHAHRPQLADFLEMERRMPGIRSKEFVVFVGKITDVGG